MKRVLIDPIHNFGDRKSNRGICDCFKYCAEEVVSWKKRY